MPSATYVEDQTLIIPVLKDGVKTLEDLWDCNQSKYVGENLFKQKLDGKYIKAVLSSHLIIDLFTAKVLRIESN
jgi:hypothetical protein